MEVDLRKLRHVVMVARVGSLSRAAEELHLTQPALSRSVAAVEESLDVRIFERGRQGAALTPIGRLLVAEAEAVLNRAETLVRNLEIYRRGDAGRIVMGLGPLIAGLVLPEISSRFLAENSTRQLHTLVEPASTLLDALMTDHIELLMCASGQLTSGRGIVIELIGHIDVGLFVRAAHPLADRRAVDAAETFDFPLLAGAELGSHESMTPRGAFICSNYDVLRQTALHSDGIWLSSPQLVRQDLQDARLQQLDVRGDPRLARRDIWVVRKEGHGRSPAADRIVAVARELLSD